MPSQMRRAAQYHAQSVAIVHGERRLAFAESWRRGVRLANALAARGLRPGERFATLEDNTVEAADAFVAAAAGNFVRVPLYARNRREAHAHMLRNTDCRLALVSKKYAPEIDGLEHETSSLREIIVRDDGYESWLSEHADTDPCPHSTLEDLTVIRHTGGTTGLPKGVAHTQRAFLQIGDDLCCACPPIACGDAVLHVGPLAHASGYLFSPAWLAGARNVMIETFDPTTLLDEMERQEISHLFLVPTILGMLAKDPRSFGRRLPRLKMVLCAAAPVSDETALAARKIFGDDAMYQAYGQTEALPISVMGPREWFGAIEGSNPLRACGRVRPSVAVEIRDAANRACAPNTPGEIVVRLESQMKGIWNDPDETAVRLVDGWVRTGDIGLVDENGFSYLLDRANDMIISGGFNIYPSELENVIASHPAVRECAVVGIPHEKWGETPLAVIFADSTAQISEREIVEFVADKLGSIKKPGRVVITDTPLPKSVAGKILRKEIRTPYWTGNDRRVAGA